MGDDSDTGGHVIGAVFGAFSMLASGTVAPASITVSLRVRVHVQTCALLNSVHSPFTSTIATSFFAHAVSTTASAASWYERIESPSLWELQLLERGRKYDLARRSTMR